MKVFFGENYSCGLNYQSDYIVYELLGKKFELTNDSSEADIIIFAGTCCCTSYHILNMICYIESILKNKKSNAKVFLTGCMSREFTIDSDLLPIKEWLSNNIDVVVPQNQPNLLLKLISEEQFKNKIIDKFGMFISSSSDDKAFIFASNGCLNNCSFCKLTFQKYPLKSIELSELKEMIDYVDEEGISELHLRGTNICQYGLDLNHKYVLPEIIDYLENKKNIQNVSLAGFAFKDAIKNNFGEVLKKSTKIKRIDGSLESGSDRILKLMRKGFTGSEIINFMEQIRQNYYKELHLNIIAGFPTETMEDVDVTLDVLGKLQPHYVSVNKYINSSFVDSGQYDQLAPDIKEEHVRVYEKVLTARNVHVEVKSIEEV